ncbi:hypothetical protein ACFX15_018674 [Malus domestica]
MKNSLLWMKAKRCILQRMSLGALRGYDKELHEDEDNTGFGGFVAEVDVVAETYAKLIGAIKWITVDVDAAKAV